MSIIAEIARTIHAIRCAADVDVERLCFEVSEAEWQELLHSLDDQAFMFKPDFRHVGSINVMGITVRKRPPDEAKHGR